MDPTCDFSPTTEPGPPNLARETLARSPPRPGSGARIDHMERPTPALHLSRVALDLRQLNAEPHTKEVDHGRVYNHHCVWIGTPRQ